VVEDRPARPRRRWLPLALTLVLVAVAFGLGSWIAADAARVEQVRALLGSPYGLVVLFALNALANATLILPVPGLALTVVAATVADPFVVGVVAGVGQTVGELTGYLAGASGRSALGADARTRRMAGWMRRWGAPILFVLAALPNPLFDVAGIIAGATRMPLRLYLVAAGAGKIVKNLVLAYATTLGMGWLLELFP
jgi:uncharacterized membrane protein YdjX (TVP38/TMEM64 family)